ncbi:hypothetical protein AK812_SmicGene25013 [Symbiodinium microadriaticum]|uniref:Uncharacterized protein n=1 Tax=Symbiodinium microadriaticum TaxID=2951 RepID=A0A1Q9DD88_SYMMI|nr:hypothetical protein AK812_SmicGene25013 [Symbiodinium microadriaticum]CAE7409239.1 unnamed protein product [Symbiodinium microadriaticum]
MTEGGLASIRPSSLSSEAASAKHPRCGERWSRLVRARAHTEPLHVDRLAALLHALAHAEGEGSADADALSLAPGRDGVANAALLETYGGPNVAVEAASLTDAVRARCGTARLQPAPPARTPAALAVRADDAAPEHALGKRFLLTPRMLLTRPAELGGDGRRVLLM